MEKIKIGIVLPGAQVSGVPEVMVTASWRCVYLWAADQEQAGEVPTAN